LPVKILKIKKKREPEDDTFHLCASFDGYIRRARKVVCFPATGSREYRSLPGLHKARFPELRKEHRQKGPKWQKKKDRQTNILTRSGRNLLCAAGRCPRASRRLSRKSAERIPVLPGRCVWLRQETCCAWISRCRFFADIFRAAVHYISPG